MGNCAASLSKELVHHCSDAEDESMMIRVLRTTDNQLFHFPGPVSVKDLLFGFHGFAVFHTHHAPTSSSSKTQQQPLHPDTQLQFSHVYYLKPWVLYPSLDSKPLLKKPMVGPDPQGHSLDMNMAHAAQREEALNSTQSPIQSPTKTKVVKKVRFADELLVQTPSLNKTVNTEEVAAVTSECLSKTHKHEVQHSLSLQTDSRFERREQMEDLRASLEEERAPYNIGKKEVNGVVRLKVVISKKELTELMSSRMSGKQAEGAIMEKMIAALLPPTTSPLVNATKTGPSRRPSLNRILEGHPVQQVF